MHCVLQTADGWTLSNGETIPSITTLVDGAQDIPSIV